MCERREDGRRRTLEAIISALESKLAKKDEVIAEIMASHVALKNILARFERFVMSAGCSGWGDRLRALLV